MSRGLLAVLWLCRLPERRAWACGRGEAPPAETRRGRRRAAWTLSRAAWALSFLVGGLSWARAFSHRRRDTASGRCGAPPSRNTGADDDTCGLVYIWCWTRAVQLALGSRTAPFHGAVCGRYGETDREQRLRTGKRASIMSLVWDAHHR